MKKYEKKFERTRDRKFVLDASNEGSSRIASRASKTRAVMACFARRGGEGLARREAVERDVWKTNGITHG